MTFPHLNRRLHLYLSLALLPWVIMYAISSYVFAHPASFRAHYDKQPQWTPRGVVTAPAFAVPPPGAPQEEMRQFARSVLAAAKMDGVTTRASFGAYRTSPKQISVYVYTFGKSTQLKFNQEDRTIAIEDKNFRWDHILTGMHARGGFDQDGFLQSAWAVIVDIVSVGFLIWVATGLYMWWTLSARIARNWGWLALVAGIASFGFFLVKL